MPIAIKYNGPKPYTDHLYGSKLHWEIGDTRDDVPEHIAVKLLRHPEFEDARKYKSKIKVEEQPREKVEDLPPLVNLVSHDEGSTGAVRASQLWREARHFGQES